LNLASIIFWCVSIHKKCQKANKLKKKKVIEMVLKVIAKELTPAIIKNPKLSLFINIIPYSGNIQG